jgi:hypothetical protein
MEQAYMYTMVAVTTAEKYVRPLCTCIILLILIYVAVQFKKGGCSSATTSVKGFSTNNVYYQEPLRDYYIKTSYNSCSTGEFQNDWVSLCALENVIKQGCRVLDFEIYQVDGRAVVATSNSTRVTEKGTYNSLSIHSVIKTIADKAVSTSMTSDTCPNPFDPLFLHFRIKSAHKEVYDDIADAIVQHLGSSLLSNAHSYENNGLNLASEPLNALLGKVIIMVDKVESNHIRATKMEELTNMMGNSAFLHSLSYNDILFTPDMDEMIDYNRKNMTFAYPNLSHKSDNATNSHKIMLFGVQMVAMCFQTQDVHLKTYTKTFDDHGFAFQLKPPDLRYKVVTAEEPKKISEDLSYGYKNYETNHYNFNL